MRSRGESCWLGIHIVRPGSGQKASYCAGRLPGTLGRSLQGLLGVLRRNGSLFNVTNQACDSPPFEWEARESGEGRSSGISTM